MVSLWKTNWFLLERSVLRQGCMVVASLPVQGWPERALLTAQDLTGEQPAEVLLPADDFIRTPGSPSKTPSRATAAGHTQKCPDDPDSPRSAHPMSSDCAQPDGTPCTLYRHFQTTCQAQSE